MDQIMNGIAKQIERLLIEGKQPTMIMFGVQVPITYINLSDEGVTILTKGGGQITYPYTHATTFIEDVMEAICR